MNAESLPKARAAALRAPALALWLAVGLAACQQSEPAPEPVRAARFAKVALESATASHEYAAEVKARIESRLGFRVGGKLVERKVEVGEAVKAAQALARLDPEDLRLGQDSARAALSSAQASHALAAAEYQRFRELLVQGFISAAELERREAALKAALAALEQARAQLAVQDNQARYAILLADAPGVVTAVEAEPGQVVAAGATVIRLARDGPRDAVFSVPEDRLATMRSLVGQRDALRVRPWGSSRLLPATLRELAAAADASTRTYLAKADLGSAAVSLGQTASVLVASPDAAVIKLPLTAIWSNGGVTSVWLLDAASMTVRPQPVQVGGVEGSSVLVGAGLQPGQEVVVAGVHVLSSGQKLTRYAPPAAAAAASQ